ncbi:MAG: hypothetical protein AB9M53_10040 [Leptothrix sp. (in: b-proteobacteria)]
MSTGYQQLVAQMAKRYDVSEEQIGKRVESRRNKLHGLISAHTAARTVATTLALTAAEQRLGEFLAAGARHVSGVQVTDALAAARIEAQRGHLSSLGYWPQPGESPASIAAHYLRGIEGIGAAGLTCSISVKVDQLGFDRDLCREVLHKAMQHDVRVHFDAQGFDTVDRTHDLLADGLRLGADVSGTLPSRWQRSQDDAERFIELGIAVRVVKGQGGDPDHPKIDPGRAYLALVERLAGRAAHVGVATHDRRVAEPALAHLQATHTPCSLEQMRSLPRIDFVALKRGLPVRIYIACGRFGLPYAIGEFARRPAILGWILRDLLVRGRSSGARP